MRPTLLALAATIAFAVPALAQQRGGFEDQPTPPPANQPYAGPQGFSFKGDELPPSHDSRYVGDNDPRYSQTRQIQQQEAQRPGGGCLRYGAVGAAGGHLAGHGVLGAVAGCAVGSYVRHRDKAAIRAEQNQ